MENPDIVSCLDPCPERRKDQGDDIWTRSHALPKKLEPKRDRLSVCVCDSRGARLSDGGDGRDRLGRDALAAVQVHIGLQLAVETGLLGAVTRDVARLAALVARLAGRVERAAVGRRAVARNVAQLAAGIALHRLRLAVASKVIRPAALVAGRRTERTGPSLGREAAGHRRGGPGEPGDGRVGAVALERVSIRRTMVGVRGGTHSQVANAVAVVAPVGAGRTAAQAEGGALGLDVSETLAVVALLRLGRPRHRALIRLVVGLLAWLQCQRPCRMNISRGAVQL